MGGHRALGFDFLSGGIRLRAPALALRMRLAFATLGCKVNQYDTAALQTVLLREGYELAPFDRGADVFIINSCAVTARAEAESRRLARRARRLNPEAVVILTGCAAQVGPAGNAKELADYVVGVGRAGEVLSILGGRVGSREQRVPVSPARQPALSAADGAEVFPDQTRAFLKVQDGCNLFCAFCIVPIARGVSRSLPIPEVLAQLARLARRGFQEVVLTGVHLGAYGADLRPKVDLADLLVAIAELCPVRRVRLSSVDPPEVTSRLLNVMSQSEVICHHLHVPLQAAEDRTLRRMRRRYDTALVRDVLREIRIVLPEAGLGTDLIAGFPGETEDEFEAGVRFLQGQPLTYFHVFPYSRRPGTSAADLPEQVPARDITRRARRLRRLGEAKRQAFAQSLVGHDLEVLFESRRDPGTGCLAGYSRNYVRVYAPGGAHLINREVRVHALSRRGDGLMGVIEAVGDEEIGAHSARV